jgi:hypothetical protein
MAGSPVHTRTGVTNVDPLTFPRRFNGPHLIDGGDIPSHSCFLMSAQSCGYRVYLMARDKSADTIP